MSEIKSLKPNFKWYQTKENLTVEVDHRDVKGQTIKIEGDKVYVKFSSNDKEYEDTLELAHEIVQSESKELDTGYQIKLQL